MGKLVRTCLDGASPKVLWGHNGGSERRADWDCWGGQLRQLNRWKEKGSQKRTKAQKNEPRSCLPCDLGILNEDKGAE